MDEKILYEQVGKVAVITFNRPEALNAFDTDLAQGTASAFRRFDEDTDAWVAVVHGNGRSFSSGADVKKNFGTGKGLYRMVPPEGFFGRSINYKPVIAAVHGHCLGLGLRLALEADLIVASKGATFGVTETARGLPGAYLLSRLKCFMPSKIVTEMLLTGQAVPVEELHRLGAVNRLTEPGDHLQAAMQLANVISELPPLAVRANVRLTRFAWLEGTPFADLYATSLKLDQTEDFREATRAFVEKRRPTFTGR